MGHGGMGCAMKTARFVIVVFNIFFFLVGLALLALGIYVMVDPSLKQIKQVLPINGNVEQGLSYLEVMAIVIIILGSILVIIGFLGCCGAMKQVKVFLIIYAIVIAIIIIFEIAITIYFVAFKSKFRDQVTPALRNTIIDKYEGPLGLLDNSTLPKPSAISLAWDFIMYNFQCCGVNNGSDFSGTKIWNRTNPWYNPSYQNSTYQNFTYPLTCCNNNTSFSSNWNSLPTSQLQSMANCAATGQGITGGCYDKLMSLIDTAKTWVIVGAVVVLVIELTAVIIALALCCRKSKD